MMTMHEGIYDLLLGISERAFHVISEEAVPGRISKMTLTYCMHTNSNELGFATAAEFDIMHPMVLFNAFMVYRSPMAFMRIKVEAEFGVDVGVDFMKTEMSCSYEGERLLREQCT